MSRSRNTPSSLCFACGEGLHRKHETVLVWLNLLCFSGKIDPILVEGVLLGPDADLAMFSEQQIDHATSLVS